MGFLSDLFDPGRKDRRSAANAARSGVIKGFNFSGPGGVSGGFNFSNGRGLVTGQTLGAFQQPFEQLIARSNLQMGAPAADMSGVNAQGADTIAQLGDINVDQISGRPDYATLGSLMNSAAQTAQKDPFELGATISEKLRALSERRNNRAVNRMFDRLKSTGNLTSSAGIQRAGDMERNLLEQGMKFDLAGLDVGQGMIRDAFGRVMGAGQMREGIAGRTFAESMGIENLQAQNAMNQFGVEAGLFGMGLDAQKMQLANQGMGLQNLQAAMGLQQLPMQHLLNAANLSGLASGSNFNLASVLQGNAAMAKSPFLEALNAGGQFASNIGFGV